MAHEDLMEPQHGGPGAAEQRDREPSPVIWREFFSSLFFFSFFLDFCCSRVGEILLHHFLFAHYFVVWNTDKH